MISKQVAAMLDKARDSIGAAHLLAEGGFYAVAVSRAYYAMFYCAEALLLQHGQSFSKHSAVVAGFGKQFAATQRMAPELHHFLLDAFEARQSADYDEFSEVYAEDAQQHIRHAEEFLTATEDYLSKDTQK